MNKEQEYFYCLVKLRIFLRDLFIETDTTFITRDTITRKISQALEHCFPEEIIRVNSQTKIEKAAESLLESICLTYGMPHEDMFVGQDGKKIIVYTKTKAAQKTKLVDKWRGFDVVKQYVGKVHPA